MIKVKFFTIIFNIYIVLDIAFKHTLFAQFGNLIILFLSLIFLVTNKFKISIQNISIILLIVLSLVTVLFNISIDKPNSISMTITLITNLFVLLYLSNMSFKINSSRLIKIFTNSLVYSIPIIIFLEFFDSDLTRLGYSISIFNQVLSINPNYIGYVFTFGLILSLHTMITVKDKSLTSITKQILFLIIILWTGSRSSLIGLIVGIIILLIVSNYPHKKAILVATFSLILVLFLSIMYIDFLYNIIGYRISMIIQFILNNDITDESIKSRLSFQLLGLDYFKNRMFLGYGLDNFRFLPGSYGTYSHNNYVELLVSLGIVGTFIYYIPHLTILIRVIRRPNMYRTLNIALVSTILILDLFFITYFERFSLYLIMILLILSSKQKTVDNQNHGGLVWKI
ncbi:O-antigen ligase family protein [Acholeplasma laidlawii]|uniref:O-antigen ligase family protein n=1 Tax=Acholeplasma laidlawii TaxID=2148 RepID=UPI003F8ED322